MQSYVQFSEKFAAYFSSYKFPGQPASLYDPNNYFLSIGGKRIRPVLCLMGNELFEDLHADAWKLATSVELFHNFTLIHDDIMDKAPLRRGMETVPARYGDNTAILAGDVMLIAAYELLAGLHADVIHPIQQIFNQTAREVCEGQQMDMDFETRRDVTMPEYLRMIELKTSVLLAASLKMGAILGGAGQRNQNLLYEFGRKLGLAFQVQDDYLDAFGDPTKFGKQVGGDILANKKTFLLIHALESTNDLQKKELEQLLQTNPADKVQRVLQLFQESGVDEWARTLKNQYLEEAFGHLEDIAVLSGRKTALKELADYLVSREN